MPADPKDRAETDELTMMAMRMHDVQFERANRLERERDEAKRGIRELLELRSFADIGYMKLRAQRDDYSRVLANVRAALLEGGQDAASRCRKALTEMDAWADTQPIFRGL